MTSGTLAQPKVYVNSLIRYGVRVGSVSYQGCWRPVTPVDRLGIRSQNRPCRSYSFANELQDKIDEALNTEAINQRFTGAERPTLCKG
jgi:hypothetical protein